MRNDSTEKSREFCSVLESGWSPSICFALSSPPSSPPSIVPSSFHCASFSCPTKDPIQFPYTKVPCITSVAAPFITPSSYSVRYALIDLDHALNSPPDHFTADQARRFAETSGPVFLLTIPPSLGYKQNPMTLYYCYDVGDSGNHLNKCIAEVTNTPWGERILFLFDPKTDLVAKPLHLSPFMDMLGNWSLRANDPGDNLYVRVSVQHPELGDYFVATVTAKKVTSSLSDYTIFFYLMPHKVALLIYWQALKLWWKNVKFLQHPRHINSEYRAEVLVRDRKDQCCKAFKLADKVKSLQSEGSYKQDLAEENFRDHQFTWRDAKWPWS